MHKTVSEKGVWQKVEMEMEEVNGASQVALE